jgi:CDP-diglyceride synthetase
VSDKSYEFILRVVYAVPLLGFGLASFWRGGLWWTAFVIIVIIAGISLEVIYRTSTCVLGPNVRKHTSLLILASLFGGMAMVMLRGTQEGTAMIFLGAVMVIFFDTFSLITGWLQPKRWRKAITPNESPKKTWGGLVGGTTLSLFAGILTVGQIERHYTEITMNRSVLYLTMAVLPVIAFFGDLNESMAKRRLFDSDRYRLNPDKPEYIKDFSDILGPHGGISDRFDAMTAVFATVGMVWLVFTI